MEPSEKEAIRARTDIVELVGAYTTLRRMGGKYKGLCPFHQEKTPSFNVDPDAGRWHCFGACSEGGDVFRFLEKAESLTFIEAAQRLAERAGITLTPRNGASREEATRSQDEKERVFSANAIALRFFRRCFARDTVARQYATGRGLAHETLEQFGVGYAPDDWSQLADFLHREKVHADDAVKAGLITASRRGDGTYTDRFRGRLIFPIVDTQERVVGFGGRLIVDKPDAPKYLNSPETPVFSKSRVLYALNRARKPIGERDLAVVVEGYMDAVAAHQAGVAFVVATLGTALTDEHVRLLRRYTKNVVLSFDADDAGVKAALKAAELIGAGGGDGTLRVLALPAGEDPDSLLRKGDVAAFRGAIDSSLTVPEFRLATLEKRFDTTTESGRIALLKEAATVIARVPSLLEQDALVRRMAVWEPSFGANSLRAEESLRAEVARARVTGGYAAGDDGLGQANTAAPPPGRRGGPTAYGRGAPTGPGGQRKRWEPPRPTVQPDYGPVPQLPPAIFTAEQTLLRALVSDEWCVVLCRLAGSVPPPLTHPLADRLTRALWPLVTGHLTPGEAIGQLTDNPLADFGAAVRMEEPGDPLSENVVADALRQVEIYREQREIAQIRLQVGEKGGGNAPLSNELLRQWSEKARARKSGRPTDDADAAP